MRHIVAAVLCVVLGGLLGHEVTRRTPGCCEQLRPSGETQPTANRVRSSVDPANVEDDAILSRLTERGAALIEQGEVVETPLLIKQLEIDKCELALPNFAANSEAVVSRLLDADSRSNIYEHAKESVVVVAGLYKCPRCANWHAAPASGFVLAEEGVVVTSFHVLNDPDKKTFVVMTADGQVYPVRQVLAASRDDDVAILKIDALGLRPLVLGTPPGIGEPIGVISHPASHFYVYSSGIVSRWTRIRVTERPVDGLQITAEFARGSSGAPVLDRRGQVIGVVRSTESIYANVDAGQQKDLQMVFKTCNPSNSIRKLVRS